MKQPFLMPPIPDSERTPLVVALLGVIEGLAARVQQQDEEIGLLKDEIRILKGGKKRPHFKPSKMDKQTEEIRRAEGADKNDLRRGSSLVKEFAMARMCASALARLLSAAVSFFACR